MNLGGGHLNKEIIMNEKYFSSRFRFDRRRTTVWKSIAGYLQSEISPDSVILDIGAGYCDFINNIKAEEKHALDIEDIKKFANKDVIVHIQSCKNLKNFDSEYFDVVFSSNFFEHLFKEEFEKVLYEINRIMKKRGRLIIIQPNFKYSYREYFDDYTHVLIFTEIGLCDALRSAGFSILKCTPRFLPFSMKSRLPKLRIFVDLYLRLPIKPFAKQMLIIAQKK